MFHYQVSGLPPVDETKNDSSIFGKGHHTAFCHSDFEADFRC